MKLFYQTHSPFARKVLVFTYELGLNESIETFHRFKKFALSYGING